MTGAKEYPGANPVALTPVSWSRVVMNFYSRVRASFVVLCIGGELFGLPSCRRATTVGSTPVDAAVSPDAADAAVSPDAADAAVGFDALPPPTAPTSDLPVPPGAAGSSEPQGSMMAMQTVHWAGFKSAVSYTFDDSTSDQVAHWPELQATGLRFTFFITSGQAGYASYDQVWKSAIASGSELGNHTQAHCHADLTGCAIDAKKAATLRDDVQACDNYITGVLGQKQVSTMAYPYGDQGYAADAAQHFFLARVVGGGPVHALDATNPFAIPCYLPAQDETTDVLDARLEQSHTQGAWDTYLIHALRPNPAGFQPIELSALVAHLEHTKAKADVWIDTFAHVGAYWLGETILDNARKQGVTANGSTGMTWSLPAHFPSGRFVRVVTGGGHLRQAGLVLPWNPHGYYEVALDGGELTWSAAGP